MRLLYYDRERGFVNANGEVVEPCSTDLIDFTSSDDGWVDALATSYNGLIPVVGAGPIALLMTAEQYYAFVQSKGGVTC